MKLYTFTKNILVITLCTFGIGCKNTVTYNGPIGFDFNNPTETKLSTTLNEISGICFDKNQTLNALEDEHGIIYELGNDFTIKSKIKIGNNGDYEDIAIREGGKTFILKSNGEVYSWQNQTLVQVPFELPNGEYESLVYNSKNNTLITTKKNQESPKLVYVKNLTDTMQAVKIMNSFSSDDIARYLNKKKIDCKPTGMAFNNISEHYFMISNKDKLLIELDNQFSFYKAYELNPALFSQPEGICFDNKNNLYISNEKSNSPYATVIKFNYTK